ncbi:MAG: ABC transporter ATP-binding protein [Actinomycetota bacterium]|nr:ABC transporter ATP-binding protein [Actinomycetota bacterium]
MSSTSTEPAVSPTTDDRPVVLRFDDVHAGYGPFHALFGVSFVIHEAEALALIGPNGAGKTTVARVASGLLPPSSGRVEVNGVDFSRRPAQAFATAGIAHAPEGRSVFATLNVEENLVLPFRRQFGRAGMRAAVDRAYELFPALGQRRRQNAGSLSGGEQRMLTLARALVLEPKLLIADELSLGLAPIITTDIYRVLERILEAGTALLVVEQHVDHALALAQQVVVLERGKAALAGHPSRADIIASVFGRREELGQDETQP